MSVFNKIFFPALISIPFCTSLVLAEEAENIERITVSSTFRGQSLQELTSSASIVDQLQISSRHAQHLEEILNLAANVNFASGASRGRFVQIRGIGERSQFAEPINPSVGFVVDDMDFSGIAGIGTLFDVEQVEILRGPQATEFGAGAMAGVIKVKTVEASAEQANHLAMSLAQDNTWSLGAAYGNAISDKVFYRVALQQFKSDGFVENIYLNRDDTDNLDEFTSRLKVKYLASDNLTLDLNYQYFDIDNGYDAFSLDNDGKTRSDQPGFDRQRTHALSLKAQADSHWGSLITILSHSQSELDYGYDEDWTYIGFHPLEYSSTDHYFRQRDTSSLDLRVISNNTSALFADSTAWIVGFYVKNTDEDSSRQYTFADADFSSQYEPQSYAIYGQTDTQLSEHMTLTAGLRVDRFDIEYADSNGFMEHTEDTLLGGKLVLAYNIDTATVYSSISRGYKAAGFNPDERVSAEQRVFDPEFSWNYELGVKGHFTNYDAFIRLALFYMDRKSTQISDFDVLVRQDGTPDFIDIIDNADNGTNWGLELESAWQVNEIVGLSANLGWLDATFKGYENAKGIMIDKQDQAQAPKYTFNVAALLHFTEKLNWRIEAEGKDEFRFSDGHNELSSSYVLVNTNLSYELTDWSISLWAKNLFDRSYYVRGFGGFNNDPRDGYDENLPKSYYQLGDGRQFGISVDYHF